MAEKITNVTKPQVQEKFMTLVFRYRENPADSLRSYGVSKFIAKIMSAVQAYNSNVRSGYDPFIDFYGAYIDPDDMDIAEQNELNQNIKCATQ